MKNKWRHFISSWLSLDVFIVAVAWQSAFKLRRHVVHVCITCTVRSPLGAPPSHNALIFCQQHRKQPFLQLDLVSVQTCHSFCPVICFVILWSVDGRFASKWTEDFAEVKVSRVSGIRWHLVSVSFFFFWSRLFVSEAKGEQGCGVIMGFSQSNNMYFGNVTLEKNHLLIITHDPWALHWLIAFSESRARAKHFVFPKR